MSPRLSLLASLLAAALLLACQGDADSPPDGHPGDSSDLGPTPDGGPDARCAAPCQTGTYCAENGECLEGCARDADCAAEEVCNPGNHACEERGCMEDRHCPAESPRCYPGEGRCGCGRDEDCPEGQGCSITGWCVPTGQECERDEQCSAGRVCTPEGWCVPPGRECRGDLHCAAGLRCTQRGFCLPPGTECSELDHCRPDSVCSDYGFCVPAGTECLGEGQCPNGKACNPQGFCVVEGRDCDFDGQCPVDFECDEPSGSCLPSPEACAAQGCAGGLACNRFGLCAPEGQECSDETHCPGSERCSAAGFCVPADRDCNDDADCADPDRVCNPYGVCVSRFDDLRLCSPCVDDGDCGSRDGICLNSNYTDRRGNLQSEDACLADCQGDLDCPRGMDCFSFRRLGRTVGACKARSTSCQGWLSWEEPCALDLACGELGICRDLSYDLNLDLRCTWTCASDDDCPAGARCGEFGYCRE